MTDAGKRPDRISSRQRRRSGEPNNNKLHYIYMQWGGWASGRNGVIGTGGAEQSRAEAHVTWSAERSRQQPNRGGVGRGGWRGRSRRYPTTEEEEEEEDKAQQWQWQRQVGNGTGANGRGGGKAGDGAGPHGCGKAEVRRREVTTGINYFRIEWEATAIRSD